MRAVEGSIVGLEEVVVVVVAVAGGVCALVDGRVHGRCGGMAEGGEARAGVTRVVKVRMRVRMGCQVDAVIRLWACAEVDLHRVYQPA